MTCFGDSTGTLVDVRLRRKRANRTPTESPTANKAIIIATEVPMLNGGTLICGLGVVSLVVKASLGAVTLDCVALVEM